MEETKSLVEQTSDQIIHFITENDLEIGDRLPNEYELSDKLSVGRSTLREAVRDLASRNILEVRQGAGTFVSDKRGIATDPLGFSLIKDQDKMIYDLFELRYILEPTMAALAAKHATGEQIKKLNILRDEIENSFKNNTEEHVELDIKFHTVIAEASGNVALLHIIPIINESIALFNKNYNILHLKIETIELHKDITKAIENHDETGALDAMTIHMANNRKEFKRIMEEK
ncbi:FadR/GntR family transcriptional regulator [Vagococcus elongatus]|uniref:GntR family transcriptional regulator n=1 Tax=Vagococcus elongatus TaxID=180344 RepID=A0A430AN86_9ENTE|nr:FadR/GntR family transcriptional regulator [Vagococcus elongatus]RSU09571.1 GntR family transcriptional regulator [Vagococcus elongatus]